MDGNNTMPEVEPLKFPSRGEGLNLQDQEDLHAVFPSRRRSCALVNTPSPCVNKAVWHIQELRGKLEDWCQQSGNLQHHMSHEEHQNNKTFRFQSSDSDTDSLISTELFIEGIGLSARESGPLSSLRKDMTDVLVEAVDLLERLEADRQHAEDALTTEKERRRTLVEKIDCISLWKQQEFPVAVQKEHEACARDISELKWHLKLSTDKLGQAKDRLIHTDILNQRLQEDINFVKKHGPLVKEKLELESDIMNQIKTAQHETDETFKKTFSELTSAEDEFKQVQQKADNERAGMTHELEGIRNKLQGRRDQLEELLASWEACLSKVKESEEAVVLKEEQCAVMSQGIPGLEQQETAVNNRVLELTIGIEVEVKKIVQLKEHISELLNRIQATRLAGETEVSQLKETFRKKRQELLALHEENKEQELEIEDYRKKINESEQAVRAQRKDRERMLLKIGQNEEQRDQAKVELSSMLSQHARAKARLEEQEQLTFMEEQRMRKVTETVKKEVMSEMKALAVLKGKIATMNEEIHREQTSSDSAEEQLKKEFEEASSATRNLEVETEGLRKIYNTKSEEIAKLTEKLSDIQTERQNTSDVLQAEINLELDHLNAIKESHSAVVKRYDNVLSRTDQLTVMSKEYRAASDQMDQIAATMPDVIEELQSVFEAVEFKNQTATVVMNALQSDITNCRERLKRSEETHATLLTVRQQKMEDIKSALKTALRENVALAQEYRELQKALMVAKREAVCVFDEKNRAEASFHDHKQLSLLQKRMHKAEERNFKQRSLYSQAELARFQVLSNENNQKIKNVQEELSNAIQRISAFLHSLTDDSTTTEDGAEKQHARAGLD